MSKATVERDNPSQHAPQAGAFFRLSGCIFMLASYSPPGLSCDYKPAAWAHVHRGGCSWTPWAFGSGRTTCLRRAAGTKRVCMHSSASWTAEHVQELISPTTNSIWVFGYGSIVHK